MTIDDQITAHRQRSARYRLDQRRLAELHRRVLTHAEAEEANRILSTDYATGLADALDAVVTIARNLHADLEAQRAEVRGLRTQLHTQARAIEAYQAAAAAHRSPDQEA